MRYSRNYKFKEPETSDYFEIGDFNANYEVIDKELYKIASSASEISATEEIVTVPSNGWTSSGNGVTQVIQVRGVSPTSIVIMKLPMNITNSELQTILSARINASSIGNSTITLQVFGTTPTSDIHLAFAVLGTFNPNS